MASTTLKLEDDQRFALMKLRRSVADIIEPHHDDRFLLRWLRARSWNPDAAEKMLRNSMAWRKKWAVDTDLKTWTAPEVVQKYYPSGQSGFDNEGAPVVIIPFAGLDVSGLLHSISKKDIIKQTIIEIENYLDMAAEKKVYQITAVIDLDGFSLKQYAWRPAVDMVITLIQMYEANYPEILKQCFIVNAPSVFSIAYALVKKFLNEYTLSKIQIYKADPKKWQAVLCSKIPASDLPKHYGGDLVDENGDPRCPSKVKLGGKVPKNYYNKNYDKPNSEHQTVIVKSGSKFCLDFIVAEEGSVLRWEFESEEHDICFGVLCKENDENESVVVQPHRVTSQHSKEIGFIPCKYPATYTVIFDNTYSLVRNKKIHYNVTLTMPTKFAEEIIANQSDDMQPESTDM